MKRSTRFTLSSAVALAVAGVIPSTVAVAQESAGLEEVFAFLTAKQGVAVSPLDKREVGLRVNWKF
jgi:hypothetical protein